MANKGVDRPRKCNRRGVERRQTRQTAREFHGKLEGQGRRTNSKHELITAARRAGFMGRTFRKAQRFEQRIEREMNPPKSSVPGKGTHSARKRS